VSFLQFLRLLRWLFTAITIFTSLPLLVANYRINTSVERDPKDVGALNGSELDLKVFTAANVKGNDILVHIGFQLIIFILVALFSECCRMADQISARTTETCSEQVG
jgi:hypothetical protein